VDWVVLDRFFPEDEERHRPFMEAVLGSAVVEDTTLTAFSVPADTPPPEAPYLYTFSQQGWHPPELDGGIWRRWMYNDGELYVYSTREETGYLQFTVDSHLDFPRLGVYQDGRLLDTFVVGDRTTYATKLITLAKGMNVFRFHAPEGCFEVLNDPHCWSEALLAPVEDDTPPCDAETVCRSFVFDSISFVRENDPSRDERADVNFGDQMRLRGWALETTELQPGDTLTATLTWESSVELSNRHVVFAHLLSADGELVAQHDDAPVGSVLPSSAWPAHATFTYPVSIQLPEDLSPGRYQLTVGVYLWPDVEHLPVLSDQSSVENHTVQLGHVEVAP
jgi:hypothetical protein